MIPIKSSLAKFPILHHASSLFPQLHYAFARLYSFCTMLWLLLQAFDVGPPSASPGLRRRREGLERRADINPFLLSLSTPTHNNNHPTQGLWVCANHMTEIRSTPARPGECRRFPVVPGRNRVPRVVGTRRNPLRSIVGDTSSQTSMPHNIRKMIMKKIGRRFGPIHPFEGHGCSPFTRGPERSPWPDGFVQTRSPAPPEQW